MLPNVATNIASPQRKDVEVTNETDDDDDTYMQLQVLIEGSETELQLPAATAQANDGAVTTQTNNGVRLLNTQTQEEINGWMNSALN